MLKLFAKILYTIVFIVELLLGFRIIFVLAGWRDSSHVLVESLFYYTDILLRPFENFVNTYFTYGGLGIDILAIVGFIAYLLIGFILLEIIRSL